MARNERSVEPGHLFEDSDTDKDSHVTGRFRWSPKLALGTSNSHITIRKRNATDTAAWTNWAAFGDDVDDWKPENLQWMDPSPTPAFGKQQNGVIQTPNNDVRYAHKLTKPNESRPGSASKDTISHEGKQASRHRCLGFPPCARSFPRAADLAYHLHFHTGHAFGDRRSGRFPCHCGVRFDNCTNLLRHEAGMHPGLAITAEGIMERMRQDAENSNDPPLPGFRSTIERLLADVLDQTADPTTVLWTMKTAKSDASIQIGPTLVKGDTKHISSTLVANEETARLCYICNHSIHIRRKKDWQKHVLEDLRPYQCVMDSCAQSEETFSSVKDLVKHHQERHSIKFAECPFCDFNLKADLHLQIKHMARHMEEIAFAVVPRPSENWEFYTSRGSSGKEDHRPTKASRSKGMSRIPVPTKRRDHHVPHPSD
jgi:hypothetical protein